MTLVSSNTKLTQKLFFIKRRIAALAPGLKKRLLSLLVNPGMKKFNLDSFCLALLASKRRAFRRGYNFYP
jgi:hypothetical protein